MKQRFLHVCGVLAVALLVTGCVDDKYDLSDVDTHVKVQVKDLVLPVNIDPITLESIFDLPEDGRIQNINGEYAIEETGDFSASEAITIDAITLSQPEPARSETEITLSRTPIRLPDGITADMSYDISSTPMDFSFKAADVSSSILSIDRITGKTDISLEASMPNLEDKISAIRFVNLRIQCPKGLDARSDIGTYDAVSGVVDIPYHVMNGNNKRLSLHLVSSGVDYVKAGGRIDAVTHEASLSGKCYVISGTVAFSTADITGTMPAKTSLKTSYSMTPMQVTAFSGQIKHDVNDININDIDINDLPDILTQAGTSIYLQNPYIKLTVTNPVTNYGLGASTGMNIISHFPEGPSKENPLASPFSIPAAPRQLICLAPRPEIINGLPTDAVRVTYTNLSNILAGDPQTQGLPNRLEITLPGTNACGQAVNLPLGQPLGKVSGEYVFFTNLALKEGSTVKYSKTEDGWNDEDVDALTIETLVVTATVDSRVPFDLEMTGQPVDIHGNDINNVEIKGAIVKANTPGQEIKIYITGTVTHLDGIRFEAVGKVPGADAESLKPTQTLDCRNIRATVSGFYSKEL